MKKSKKRIKVTDILAIFIVVAGIVFLGYPTFSDWWNSSRMTKVIDNYNHTLTNMNDSEIQNMLNQASEYNKKLYKKENRFEMSEKDKSEYENILKISGGIMGELDIPKLDVKIPIYHGDSPEVLQVGVGHMPGSSFPVGGKNTHVVLMGHSGLPSSKLLTGLDQMKKKDIFILTLLGEKFTYEVDKITTVLPDNTQPLDFEDNKDLCTLITCTPYGINSHRLMVRGHRIPNLKESQIKRGNGKQKDRLQIGYIIAIIVVLLAVIIAFVKKRIKTKKNIV